MPLVMSLFVMSFVMSLFVMSLFVIFLVVMSLFVMSLFVMCFACYAFLFGPRPLGRWAHGLWGPWGPYLAHLFIICQYIFDTLFPKQIYL